MEGTDSDEDFRPDPRSKQRKERRAQQDAARLKRWEVEPITRRTFTRRRDAEACAARRNSVKVHGTQDRYYVAAYGLHRGGRHATFVVYHGGSLVEPPALKKQVALAACTPVELPASTVEVQGHPRTPALATPLIAERMLKKKHAFNKKHVPVASCGFSRSALTENDFISAATAMTNRAATLPQFKARSMVHMRDVEWCDAGKYLERDGYDRGGKGAEGASWDLDYDVPDPGTLSENSSDNTEWFAVERPHQATPPQVARRQSEEAAKRAHIAMMALAADGGAPPRKKRRLKAKYPETRKEHV